MKGTCLNKKCRNDAEVRGVCGTCYVHFRQAVVDGETTWEELEKLGAVLAPQRKPSTAREWLQKLKRGKRPS